MTKIKDYIRVDLCAEKRVASVNHVINEQVGGLDVKTRKSNVGYLIVDNQKKYMDMAKELSKLPWRVLVNE